MSDEELKPGGLEYYEHSAQGMSARDVTALVHLFVSMLQEVKKDLLSALENNSRGAQERWEKHEKEHADLAERLDCHIEEAQKRWKADDQEEERFDARVEPIKAFLQWLRYNWKDILLLIIGLLALIGFSTETLERLVQ